MTIIFNRSRVGGITTQNILYTENFFILNFTRSAQHDRNLQIAGPKLAQNLPSTSNVVNLKVQTKNWRSSATHEDNDMKLLLIEIKLLLINRKNLFD